MRRTAAILAGLTLVGGSAVAAAQETGSQDEYGTETQQTDPYGTETQQTDPYGTAETQEPAQTTEPEMGTVPESESTYGAETGQMQQDVSQMSAEELSGKSITTTEGEEIGSIEQVGYSSTHQEQVATVNVGGFLGVGEKLIAIPLSQLHMGSDDSLQTAMSRDEIESQQEFDPSNLSTTDPYQQQ